LLYQDRYHMGDVVDDVQDESDIARNTVNHVVSRVDKRNN